MTLDGRPRNPNKKEDAQEDSALGLEICSTIPPPYAFRWRNKDRKRPSHMAGADLLGLVYSFDISFVISSLLLDGCRAWTVAASRLCWIIQAEPEVYFLISFVTRTRSWGGPREAYNSTSRRQDDGGGLRMMVGTLRGGIAYSETPGDKSTRVDIFADRTGLGSLRRTASSAREETIQGKRAGDDVRGSFFSQCNAALESDSKVFCHGRCDSTGCGLMGPWFLPPFCSGPLA